ncbi:hypothetical protein B7463_g2896, partial [Scytalidium lignicola]
MAGTSKKDNDRSGRRRRARRSAIKGGSSLQGNYNVDLSAGNDGSRTNTLQTTAARVTALEDPPGRKSNTGAEFYNGGDQSTFYGNSTTSADLSTPTEDSEIISSLSKRHSVRNTGLSRSHVSRLRATEQETLFVGSEFPTTQNYNYPQFIATGSDEEIDFREAVVQESTLAGARFHDFESYHSYMSPLEIYYSTPQRHEDIAVRHKLPSSCSDRSLGHVAQLSYQSPAGYGDGSAGRR